MFAEALVSMIVEAAFCPATQRSRSRKSRYQVMWTGYHCLSISSELSTLWSSYLTTNEHSATFVPHFIQPVTRRVMDESAFSVDSDHSEDMQRDCPLKADEEQALRYTAGYVPMKLKQKYSKQTDSVRALKYLELLSHMHEEEDDKDIDFLQYTKLWIDTINRGGLYRVNNDAYMLFRAMELATRRVLSVVRINKDPSIKIKHEIHHAIMNDPSVAAHWCSLLSKSEDLQFEDSDSLLEEISDKWVTIRGHSFASSWVEQYQLAHCKTTSQKRT